jgi:hypothetical protein
VEPVDIVNSNLRVSMHAYNGEDGVDVLNA